MKSFRKNVFRTIKESFGRFLAIICIVALGVMFYVGLNATTYDMLDSANDFYKKENFYDFMLVSNMGFTEDDISLLRENNDYKNVEGALYLDALTSIEGKDEGVTRIHSITDKINKLQLEYGRMPENDSECVVESREYNKSDIGKEIIISENNKNVTKGYLKNKKLKITGIVSSPLYLSYQRGTTNIGGGSILSYIYVNKGEFNTDYYTQIFIDIENDDYIYSDEYDKMVEKYEDKVGDELTYPEELNVMLMTLTRDDNAGYATFEENANIVKSLTILFPLFFATVAALVCIITMGRMIEDERMVLGVFKALGYKKITIYSKYIIYSLSATVTGCILGFMGGSIIFPTLIWNSYRTMYDFAKNIKIKYYMDMFVIGSITSIAVILLTTLFVCRTVLEEVPAGLLRPKAPSPGKRVLVEKIGFIWKRLSFLHKVTLRNCFRYKKRFMMMLIGISGCVALLITGYGIEDSISDICNLQYDNIEVYDYMMSVGDGLEDGDYKKIDKKLDKYTKDYLYVTKTPITVEFKGKKKDVSAFSIDDYDKLDGFISFKNNGEKIENTDKDSVIISSNMADLFEIKKGDKIKITFDNLKEKEYKVVSFYDNYVQNYVYFNDEAYLDGTKESPYRNCIFANVKDGGDIFETSAKLQKISKITSVFETQSMRDYFDEMIKRLKTIIVLVIFCAGLLAFVVMYNLNNINIMERIKEIATLKVLGSYENETASYVFRENIILTFLGILCGIPLGKVMHKFVMEKIRIEIVCFDIHINLSSYLISAGITIIFAFMVNIFMKRKIKRINMAESLKSIE